MKTSRENTVDYLYRNFWFILFSTLMIYHSVMGLLEKPHWTNPRTMNGLDTLYTPDSAYVIKFQIDSVYKPLSDEDYEDGPY